MHRLCPCDPEALRYLCSSNEVVHVDSPAGHPTTVGRAPATLWDVLLTSLAVWAFLTIIGAFMLIYTRGTEATG